MALIDIMKLNEELDKIIATQEAEIEKINEDKHQNNAYHYMQFVTTLETMYEVVNGIGKELRVNLGVFDDGYGNRHCYWITFTPRYRSLRIQYSGSINPAVTKAVVQLGSAYPDRKDLRHEQWDYIDQATEWWVKNAAEFEHEFEEACVKALKQKAEAANAKYQEALKRKEKANV